MNNRVRASAPGERHKASSGDRSSLEPYRGEEGVAGPDVSTNGSRPNFGLDPSFFDD
jgi:hypothetical protein